MQPNGISFNFDFNPVLNIQKLNATLQQLKLSLGKFGNDIKLIDEAKLNSAFKRIDEQAKSAGKSIGDELEEGISKGTDAGTKKAEVPLKQFQGKFASMGLNMKNIFSTALGVFGGGALLGGLESVVNGVKAIWDSGVQLDETMDRMGTAFQQAGVPASKLNTILKQNLSQIDSIGNEYAFPIEKLREFSSAAAGIGGATGKANQDLVKLAMAVEESTGGMVDGTMAIRVFTKGVSDPESQFAMDRLTKQFPALATALKGVEDPALATQKALSFFGPTFDNMKDKGIADNLVVLKNQFQKLKEGAGQLFTGVLSPIVTFLTGSVIPALQKMWVPISAGFQHLWTVVQPLWDTFKWFGGFIVDTLWGGIKQIGDALTEAFGLEGTSKLGIADYVKALFHAIGKVLEPLIEIYKFLYQTLAVAFKIVIMGIVEYVKLIIRLWKEVWDLLKQVGSWLTTTFIKAWNNIKSVFESIYSFFSNVYNTIKNVIVYIAKALGVFDAIKNYFNQVYNTIKSIFSTIGKWVDGIVGKISGLLGKKSTKMKVEVEEEVISNQDNNSLDLNKDITKEKGNQTKEEQSQYAIAKKKYELVQEQRRSESELSKLKLELEEKSIGIQLTQQQINERGLKSANENINIVKKQIEQFQSVYDIALKQFKLEEKRGKVSQKTSDEYTEAQNTLKELNKTLLESQIAELDLEVKIKMDQTKNKEEIAKLQNELAKTTLEIKIKAGLANNSDMTKLAVENLKSDLIKLNKDISANVPGISANFDEKTYFDALQKKIVAEQQIGELGKKLTDQLEEERIASINDFAVRERELAISNANKLYKEKIQKARGNYREEMQAFVELQNEKFKAEQQYLIKSSNSWTQNLISFSDAFKSNLANLTFEIDNTKTNEVLKQIDEEEAALSKSLNARTTAYEDYTSSIIEMDKKRAEQGRAINNYLLDSILTGIQKSLEQTKKSVEEKLNETLEKYTAFASSQVDIDLKLNELKKKSKETELNDSHVLLYQITQLQNEATNSTKTAEDIKRQAYIQTASIAGLQFGNMIAQQKSFAKASVMSMLAAAKALAPIMIVEILGKEFATKSLAGIATSGLLTGLLLGALSAAESAANRMKLWRGKVDIQGPGTTTSDSIPSDLSRRESVINARGTIPNIPELKWINQTGKNVFDYYISEEPERIKEAFYQIAEAKDLMKMGPVINLMIEERNREQVTELRNIRMENRILNRKIEKLTQVVEEGYYRRKETFEHNINLEFDDEVITTRADRRKLASLRKG